MSLFGNKMKGRNRKSMKGTEGSAIQEERKNLLSPESGFFTSEAYKTLRTNVSFALTENEGCKVIMVTSAMQGEGKSITAVNLAISYAMAECKVLIVDCDLRRPKLARLLRMNSKVGLSNLIINPKLKDEAVQTSGISGMDVLLSGDIPPNPSELLGSRRMQSLLEELREFYDVIILDSPPVNMVTDAVVLAPKSDGVLVLVRANYTDRGAIIHAVEQLGYAKAKILGFILNDVNMEKNRYSRKEYRYKRYGYRGEHGYGRCGYAYSDSMPSSLTDVPGDKV